MNILVVNAYPSWAPSLEAAQHALGLISVRSKSKTPDGMPFKEVENLKLLAAEHKAGVVILDNHWVPSKLVPISLTLLQIADQLRAMNIEAFYLNNANAQDADDTLHRREFSLPLHRTDFRSELWRAFKPVKHDVGFSFNTMLIDSFWAERFESGTGTVKHYSSGGDGAEDVEHWIRIGHAFWERDWPKIAKAVEKELSA
jgi:hypothetical protein